MTYEWHGWSMGEQQRALHIGRLPGRSSVALYALQGGRLEVLAYFKSELAAETAARWIDRIAESFGYSEPAN